MVGTDCQAVRLYRWWRRRFLGELLRSALGGKWAGPAVQPYLFRNGRDRLPGGPTLPAEKVAEDVGRGCARASRLAPGKLQQAAAVQDWR
ncbi:MAG: hypothetical protein EAZ71_06675 [Verrucomicrobia bacterium]|nr:MAG: hypothetical protein EAZ82_12290 [Verrucomicrobiota bacterium]TAF25824.1 MAG: hypothetical protein EAZ71_06675 [Verrucomicrobiota bacterium]